jgi:carbon monoxide dehydrogenase subunit G
VVYLGWQEVKNPTCKTKRLKREVAKNMFRVSAKYNQQIEIKASIERAREFFGDMRNFVGLMPGVEEITNQAGGIKRWLISANVPVIGKMRMAFAMQPSIELPHHIEWKPVSGEQKNLLSYSATFEPRDNGSTLVNIAQHVEVIRQHAKEIHSLASWIGENRISSEMQKRVAEMIHTFLQRSKVSLER